MKINTHQVIYKIPSSLLIKSILCFCFLVNLNFHSNAQSSIAKIEKLGLKCAKGKRISCEKLFHIAKSDHLPKNRVEAIKRINNQEVLFSIANSKYAYEKAKIAAINKIDSQYHLVEIVLNEKNKDIKLIALEKVYDENLLSKITLSNIPRNISFMALKKITDQTILAIIVNSKEIFAHRINATRLITNQNILLDLAKNNPDWIVRSIAVEKITDQNVLITIAKDDHNRSVRISAIKKITDQRALIDIVKLENEWQVREEAVKKITNQNFLIEIAENDTIKRVSYAAFKNITDQKFVLNIVRTTKNWKYKLEAANKLTDQNILLDIIRNWNPYELQCIALNHLSGDDNYLQINEIIKQNIKKKQNLSAIGTLKLIPIDLKDYYESIEISTTIRNNTKEYDIGIWRSISFSVIVKTNLSTKRFYYAGYRGSMIEQLSYILEVHLGTIKIKEICEHLLSSFSKGDLLKIANESELIYLRNAAKNMLKD